MAKREIHTWHYYKACGAGIFVKANKSRLKTCSKNILQLYLYIGQTSFVGASKPLGLVVSEAKNITQATRLEIIFPIIKKKKCTQKVSPIRTFV